MTKNEAKQRIVKLRELINHHRYEYHVLDIQNISDEALDSLKHELKMLEDEYPDLITADSPTQRVAGKALDKFEKVTHQTRMTSLVDVFNYEELQDWEDRNKKIVNTPYEYYVEIKIDGFAISLIYEDGQLVTAATRGDGFVGEDVTQNVKTIESIPLTLRRALPGRVEVRGEIFMSKKEFARINKEQERIGEKLYANPRNLAAGSIRQLDSSLTASRKLDFFAYEILGKHAPTLKSEEHVLLQELGFKVSKFNKLLKSIAEVQSFFESWKDKREKQDFLIDGLVIKINNAEIREELGIIGKAPRGMCAYKFPAEQTTTKIISVDWSVGRTGVLTPVATFNPVQVAGTTVQHATLHNPDEIQRLGVKIGDTVIIEKAGDIIPKVVSVLTDLRTGEEKNIVSPKKCPVCGSPTVQKEEEVALYCSNKKCFATEIENMIHFVSKKAFDIDGLGEKVVEQLAQNGLIKDVADLFTLKKEELLELEGFQEKSAQNLIDAMKERTHITLPRFIYALGIRHVGEETANALAQHFGSIEAIAKAKLEELMEVPDIGDVVAQSLVEYFSDKIAQERLERLLSHVTIQKPQKASNKLEGKTIVVTGSLQHFTRDEIRDTIRRNGGKPATSVSKQTDYVVVGQDAGSKADKAKELGVRIISEEEFKKLLQ